MSTQQRRRYCSGTLDSEAAELVAQRVGLRAQEHESLIPYINEGDGFECEGCGDIVRHGAKAFWKPGGGEYYYEGSSYGSHACASLMWQSHPGTIGDWLERLGWEFGGWSGTYFAEKGERYIWFKRAEDPDDDCAVGPIIAREGGTSYRCDLARARKLAKETRAMKRGIRRAEREEARHER